MRSAHAPLISHAKSHKSMTVYHPSDSSGLHFFPATRKQTRKTCLLVYNSLNKHKTSGQTLGVLEFKATLATSAINKFPGLWKIRNPFIKPSEASNRRNEKLQKVPDEIEIGFFSSAAKRFRSLLIRLGRCLRPSERERATQEFTQSGSTWARLDFSAN